MKQLHSLPNVLAVVIARRDGVVITSDLPSPMDSQKIAAMAASIIGTSEMVVQELKQGSLTEVTVGSKDGKVLGLGAGEEAILVTLLGRDANVKMIQLNLEMSAAEVDEALRMGEPQELLTVNSKGQ